MGQYLFTSESVTNGHPDKVCDQISDAVLDMALDIDKNARVAVETVVNGSRVLVFGECSVGLDRGAVTGVVRETLRRIGYDRETGGTFSADEVPVVVDIASQSDEIAAAVTTSLERRNSSTEDLDLLGAGDQGIMFGYAVRQNGNLMPVTIDLAHVLAKRLEDLDGFGPDGKTQVTVRHDEDGTPLSLDTVLVSVQHRASSRINRVEELVHDTISRYTDEHGLESDSTRVLVNPSGAFTFGGPAADAGLTGRKIVVDTYGGAAPHGGGAFSGKDPSKVDRSAAYAARWVAKSLLHNLPELRFAEVQLSYAIGVATPVSVRVRSSSEEDLAPLVQDKFDLRPAAIIEQLGLREQRYVDLAAYGHFGGNAAGRTWESPLAF